MKQRQLKKFTKINGFYVNELINGFMGDKNEGRDMLSAMGLNPDKLPFSAALFISKKRARWKDKDGNSAYISFRLKQDQLESYGTYKGNDKSMRLFREWGDHENPETIAKLESGAIGDLCMRCIFENMN